MLDLFKRKKKKSATGAADQTTILEAIVESKKPKDSAKMLVSMVFLMHQYWAEQEQHRISNINVLIEQRQRLTEMNLTKTKNYELVNSKISEHERVVEGLEFISDIRKNFNPHTILVGLADFNALVNKYKLKIGLLSDYTGVIPEKNLQEIASVKNILHNKYKGSRSINHYTEKDIDNNIYDYYLFKLERVERALEEDKKACVKLAEKYNNLLYTTSDPSYGGDIYSFGDHLVLSDEDKKTFSDLGRCKFIGSRMKYSDLLVACPEKDLKPQQLEFIDVPLDPIVFQYTKFGVLVHSVWGDEAEDAIIREYTKINNIFGEQTYLN